MIGAIFRFPERLWTGADYLFLAERYWAEVQVSMVQYGPGALLAISMAGQKMAVKAGHGKMFYLFTVVLRVGWAGQMNGEVVMDLWKLASLRTHTPQLWRGLKLPVKWESLLKRI
jgi:hypothetical protein